MPNTTGPLTWLQDTAAQRAEQATKPLLDAAQWTRSHLVEQAQEIPVPSFASHIPSLEALMGGPSTPTQQQPGATAAQPEQSFASAIPSLASLGLQQQLPSTPSGTPAGMPSNAPQTGNINSSTITQGDNGPALRPGESVGSVSFGAPSGPPSSGVMRWSEPVQAASRKYNVPPEVIMGIMDIESGGNPEARSSQGAMSLMQVMPFHYGEGENGMDPLTSIDRGTKILADNYRKYGDWDRAAAAYFGAIDDQGNITDATDATGTNGSKYVTLFRGAASKYGSAPRNAGDAPTSSAPAPASAPPAVPSQQGSSTAGAPQDSGDVVDVISPEGTVIRGVPRHMVGEGPGKYAPSKGWQIADPRQSLNADAASPPVASAAPPPQTVASAAPAGNGPEQAMWSPDGPVQQPMAYQAATGRSGGQGTMQRQPLADEQPYNPDDGPHELAQGTYNDPTSGGTQTTPIPTPDDTNRPETTRTDINAEIQDGRTTPPTPAGQWEPVTNLTQPPQTAQDPGQWLAEDSQSTPPSYDSRAADQGPHESPPQAPSGMKTVWDAAGNVLGYVKDAAQAVGSTIANEGVVRPIARPISNTIRAAQGREPLTPETEPVPTVDRAVMETAHSLGSNVDAARTGYAEGNYGQAALGVVGALGDLAPSTTMARQLNEMAPRLDTPLGAVGLGDAVMAAGLAHAAVTLGYGAIKAGGRTWSRIVQAIQEGVPAEKFGAWLDSVEGGRAAGVAEDVLAAERPRTASAAEPSPMSFADVSRAADSPSQKAAREAASQPVVNRPPEDQAIREQFGRPWQEVAPARPGSMNELGDATSQIVSEGQGFRGTKERVLPEERAQIGRPVQIEPQSISLNARPGASASAGLLGDVGNSLSGGVAGATTGAALPADSEEQRRQNALTGAGIGMVAGPAVGRLLPRAEGALATAGVGPNKPVASPAQSANPNIRNVARMMGGDYKPVGESRSIGEILSAALTDRWAIHANVPKEARARIKAVGGTAPAERLAERIEVNGPTIAHQRTVEEIGPALQSVGKDDEWLAQVLVHRHNLDIAKEKAQEVYDAAIAAGQSPARAQIRADRVRSSRQFSGGMTEKDITQALVDVQTEIGPARFKQVTDAAQAFWDSGKQNLQRKLDDGIIDQATYNTLTQKYPHYVRTDIADYAEKGPANPSPGGKALGIGNNGIKPLSIEGTSKDRVNPIMSTIDSIYGTESAITRNAAARDLVAVRDADPTLAGLFREVAPDAQAYRGNQQTMHPPDYTMRGGEEKLTHWDNGVARQFVIPKEYNQLLSPTPGALLGDNAGPLRAFYSLIRGQLTTHNPGLQYVTSPLRDLRDAAIGMQTSAGAAAKRTGASLPENVAREAGGSMAALPEAVGRLVQAIPQVAEGFFSNTYGPRVAELRRSGMGFDPRPSPEYRGKLPRWLANPQDTRAAMEDLQRTGGLQVNGKADVARIIRNSLSLYAERVGNRIEMLPRVAAANMERGRGGDMLSQVVTGQNATVSFLKGGWLTRQVNAVDPFLNTTVQSGAQNARLYRKSPAAFTAALITTVGIPALLAEAWNRSDPERAKAYEDRPEYLKNTGIIWELPGLPQGTGSLGEKMPNFLWEPLGNFGWAGMAAREALGVADKATGLIPPTETAGNDRSDPMYWAQRGADILAMFSPVKGGDAGSAVASLLPPVASEAVDLAANRDFFRGSTIATDRTDERASNLAKTAVGITNALTGREDRPSQAEHLIAGPTGYAGQLARGVSNLGRENDQKRPIQDVPGVGTLASRIIRDSGGQRLQDERDVATASPAVRQALKDAGLRTDELVLPSSNIKDMPITRQEQATAQRDFNKLLDQKVKEALADPDWKTSSTFEREKWLKNLATRARTEAGGNVVDTWDDATYDFRTDKRVQKRTGS